MDNILVSQRLLFSRSAACALAEQVLETCSISGSSSSSSSSFPGVRQEQELEVWRPEDAERESRGRGLAVLPALPFRSFLPGAVGKSGPFLFPHPPVCSSLVSLPALSSSFQTGARAKEAWPGVQLGLVCRRKDSNISHLTKAKVYTK